MMSRHVVHIPFVPEKLYAQTFEWSKLRDDVIPWPINDYDYTAYWRMLLYAWKERCDTVVVEHDMLPADGVIEEMVACDQPWCTSPYRGANKNAPDIVDGLGCVKFSETLKSNEFDLMRVVGEMEEDGLPAKIWKRLDVRIAKALRARGYEPHTHRRSTHLHYERVEPLQDRSAEVRQVRTMIGNVGPIADQNFDKCSKPDCMRKVKKGIAFCCHPCSYAAEKKFEIHDDGPLGHTEDCNQRDKERGSIDPAHAFFYNHFQ